MQHTFSSLSTLDTFDWDTLSQTYLERLDFFATLMTFAARHPCLASHRSSAQHCIYIFLVIGESSAEMLHDMSTCILWQLREAVGRECGGMGENIHLARPQRMSLPH